ncbi:hypothetical protein [Actinomadura violacea]|uniref:DUF6199 domain-containing protein n=1 Tax=Actinomadura violacea TaxID=2819934 RepID=A0ABS3RLB6_9ACTN|nr:hypothetical protein [Actinomadura violacea]MBO2456879.1 hypothetical protein [Actinomadura violacea]
MTALIVFVVIAAVVMFVLGCMDQRKVYLRTRGWQYRNPEALEPSDAALTMSRVGYFFGTVVLLVLALVLKSADRSMDYSTSQVHSVAYAAARSVESGRSSGLGSAIDASSSVYSAVNDEGNGKVKIRDAGGDKYELTNRKGRNPVCLTVTVDNALGLGNGEPWSHTVTTSVTDGPC